MECKIAKTFIYMLLLSSGSIILVLVFASVSRQFWPKFWHWQQCMLGSSNPDGCAGRKLKSFSNLSFLEIVMIVFKWLTMQAGSTANFVSLFYWWINKYTKNLVILSYSMQLTAYLYHRATIQAPLPSPLWFFLKATDVSASPESLQ